jgi:hypothetical protein
MPAADHGASGTGRADRGVPDIWHAAGVALRQWQSVSQHSRPGGADRRIGAKGYIKWHDDTVCPTEARCGQTVALAEGDDGDGRLEFRQFDLAVPLDTISELRNARPAPHAAAPPLLAV